MSPRVMRTLAAILVTGFAVAVATPAGAQSTRARLGDAENRLTRVKSQYERIGDAFARAEAARGRTSNDIERTEERLTQLQDELRKLRATLKTQVREAYKMGGVGFFEFMLQARSFRDFTLRLFVIQKQSTLDEATILGLRKTKAEVESEQKTLRRQQQDLSAQTSTLRRQGRELSISLAQAQALVRDLQGKLKLEQVQQLFRVSTSSTRAVDGQVVPMEACPIAGPHVVTNSFGDPRGGGTRRHQGNDIMSPKGTPVVAVVSGRVERRTGGLGGLTYHLQGSGALFYYAHLNDYVAPDGAYVKAGQLIGHNGNTGDAAGGPDHVHFEIHPGQGWGSAIDPYPSLSRVC